MSGLVAVLSAIQNQAAHHRKMTFQEEFLALRVKVMVLMRTGPVVEAACGARRG